MHINNIPITTMNRNDPEYEVMFDALINEVFGFSFDVWLRRKLWDERYVSYSIIDGGKMLANLCICDTDMKVDGERFRAIQLGAVSTSKSARGKGLSKRLMERVMSDYADIPAFLFANKSVLDFYPRFGFRQVQTYRPVLYEIINNDPQKAVKLDADDPVVVDKLNGRSNYSEILDCLNTQPTQRFHLLMDYPDDIYHLPEFDVIVVAYQDNNRLFLADVFSGKPVAFEAIKCSLPFENIDLIEFGFCPDRLDVSPVWEAVPMDHVMFFVKGNWNLPEVFRFPAMSET